MKDFLREVTIVNGTASNRRMTKHPVPAQILVMEDNPADVHLLRMALDHHGEEYRLELLRDGEEAIRLFRVNNVSVRP